MCLFLKNLYTTFYFEEFLFVSFFPLACFDGHFTFFFLCRDYYYFFIYLFSCDYVSRKIIKRKIFFVLLHTNEKVADKVRTFSLFSLPMINISIDFAVTIWSFFNEKRNKKKLHSQKFYLHKRSFRCFKFHSDIPI